MADTECRVLCWRGSFLQKFANARLYVFMFGIIGLVQASSNSYQSAILTTVEKRFQIPSKLSGLIISGVDIGTCICVIYLSFYGSKLHKPRSVGFGIFLTAFACILWILPHFIYGPSSTTLSSETARMLSESEKCEVGEVAEDICEQGSESIPATTIFLIGNILFGIGTCFYWTLGLTYIDDNANKRKTPIYLCNFEMSEWLSLGFQSWEVLMMIHILVLEIPAITMLIRMLGPTLGYMIASYSLTINQDTSPDSTLTPNDPKWIGAWWFGFIIIFALLMSLLVFSCAFPRFIPKAYNRKLEAGEVAEGTSQPTFKEFKLMASRLMKNKIFMANTISSTFFVFGLMGLSTFGPKYLESQFLLSPSEASFATGSIGLLCTGLGVLSSGIVITYFKPSSRNVALWNVIVECFDIIGHLIFAFLGCPTDNLQGHWGENNEWSLAEECNKFCSCPPSVKYSPLCSESSGALFYSPCHAGCASLSLDTSAQNYENCYCAPNVSLTQGPCPVSSQCNNEFYAYVIIICVLKFFSASGRAGNTLIQFRSVLDKDKAVSIAVTEGFMSLFAFVPSPIIFGILVDYTCLVWGESCGRKGNCWLYDSKAMRYFLNFTTVVFLILGTIADVVVWIYSSDVDMFDTEEKEDTEKEHVEELLENRYYQTT